MKTALALVTPLLLSAFCAGASAQVPATQSPNHPPPASDPGVRAGSVGAGLPLATLSAAQMQYFLDGFNRFVEVDSVSGAVTGEPGSGLGPGFNATSCGACHAQPFAGGSSPSMAAYPFIGPNPQIAAASDAGATNAIPTFITADGPVRETRFPFVVSSSGNLTQIADGGVHDIYTVSGRSDAPGCNLAQPNYDQMQQLGNLIFRIPTPVFGAGLIENIADAAIIANMNANSGLKHQFGISGHPNTSGNDGSITRFGWKAQNKSLEIFSGEAYNVEMGVTNELFPNKRANPPATCVFNGTPEDHTNFDAAGTQIPSDTVGFSVFMRFLAAPTPSNTGIPGNPPVQSIRNGQSLFGQVHCDLCHTPSLQTTASSLTAGLNTQTAALYSDLLVHNMGTGLADQISQGAAGPDEFRTAPLWGVGQRIFFLHDGRATPQNGGLLTAILAHSSQGSEASNVISSFRNLSEPQKQDLLNFLRSL
ncbi:MAG: di-heme oxidoredictase family protein [Rudaea sp.]|nr:di-heme oxidoredictase family protein [Rudaea sp.]